MDSHTSLQQRIEKLAQDCDLYLRLGQYIVCQKALEDGLLEHGQSAKLHNLLGVVYHQQSHFLKALDEFEQAIIQNPHFLEASLNMIITLFDLGEYEESARLHRELVLEGSISHNGSLGPYDRHRVGHLYSELARIYLEAKDLPQATRQYQDALKQGFDSLELRLSLAECFLSDHNIQAAEEHLLKARQLQPTHPKIYILLGICAYRSDKLDLSKRYWQKAFELDPHDPTTIAYSRVHDSLKQDRKRSRSAPPQTMRQPSLINEHP